MEQRRSPGQRPPGSDKVDMGEGSFEESFGMAEEAPPNVQGPRKVPVRKQPGAPKPRRAKDRPPPRS